MRDNQYGGVRGLGTDHVLVQYWQEIPENLEDYRAASIITSVGYSKAFNRMSFQHCLAALAFKGAPTPLIRLVATFLTGRTMTVKTGNAMSRPRAVNGGCHQGSILGVFLFNVTIDDLEAGCPDVEDSSRPRPAGSSSSDEDPQVRSFTSSEGSDGAESATDSRFFRRRPGEGDCWEAVRGLAPSLDFMLEEG